MPSSVVIVRRKEFFFWEPEALLSCHTGRAEENLDGVFFADSGIPDGNQVVAKRMVSEVQDGFQIAIPADFACFEFGDHQLSMH